MERVTATRATAIPRPSIFALPDRPEFRDWHTSRMPKPLNVPVFVVIGLIPVFLFALVLIVAHHK